MTDREPVNIMGVIAFPEPDKSKRRIRFIDAAYNTLFYIPDGASIVMTRMDGSSVIRPCTYIDDYHTLVGSEVYHICEFAEAAQRTGTVYEPLDPTQLPAGAGYYEIYQIDNVGKVDYGAHGDHAAHGNYLNAVAGGSSIWTVLRMSLSCCMERKNQPLSIPTKALCIPQKRTTN